MPLHVALTHRTTYRFDRDVTLGPHLVRLRPTGHCRTPILSYSLRVDPAKHFLNWQQDPFGNHVARVVVADKARELSATVGLVADMAPINPFDFFLDEDAASFPFSYAPELAADLEPYLRPLPAGPNLERYLAALDISARPTISFLCDLNAKLSRDIAYRQRLQHGVQTPEQTLLSRSGSCRDSGWLLVQILRRMRLAARFVSGYLIQLNPDLTPPTDRSAEGDDSCDLHAWAEVYIPGAGWIGLDATSGLLAGEGHIPLAATPSPLSAAPITGTHSAAEVDFSVQMSVTRLRESPRTAHPYTEVDWAKIVAAGEKLDKRLQAGDVRLSTGGEPTFVAAGDSEAPEWSIAALGPTKRTFADKLARRLLARFAKGGLLHYGQGKWYPGETAARWSFGVYWRSDGAPLWHDLTLIAEEVPEPAALPPDAKAFATELCRQLDLPPTSAIPAYEDAAHYMLIERKLPLGSKPETNNLADPAERARVMRAFEQGLGQPAGYVLPLMLMGGPGHRTWRTERWAFKRGHLFLVPGDSPIGLRLPLSSLPEISFLDFPEVSPVDPFAPPQPLPDPRLPQEERPNETRPDGKSEPVRTALAIELRNGRLGIFLPPLTDSAAYAELVASVERAAARTGQKIHLEGYPPPFDPRLCAIKVTPDPGVIEVNVHPATSWGEARDITEGVYEEAQAIGLAAEKFKLDGRHASTGGGNHIVLGGITPADSPFLRRPDLLGSLLAYWQNHPSLSYLFAGQFIGPTSQAPRVDEARHEALYELEIALGRLPEPGGAIAPWAVDRLFRNLLVDVTGNTHRAEICIDKLYAPEGPMGRLGLVELRAFEMPPHVRMSLAEQLLIRALVAWFWERPYRQPLLRWGCQLHDRFMLPHFLWADLESVAADLAAAGLPVEARWFLPHFEFRCPWIGAAQPTGIEIELRQALEPWLVLGEDRPSGAATRTVDSSLERLQVTVSGMAGERYVLACNGYRVPLAPAGRDGQSVAGVRFRVWQPAQGFHPTIAPHVPLSFDLVDTWNDRSIGGCRYHTWHTGGAGYQALPVNALAAESRRLARFESIGHSPGTTRPISLGVHPEAPLTLDLRRGV